MVENNEKILNEVLSVVKNIYTDVNILKQDVSILKQEVSELKDRMGRVEHKIERLEDKQERLEDKFQHQELMIIDIWKSRDKVTAQVTWDFIWKAVGVNAAILFIAVTLFPKFI